MPDRLNCQGALQPRQRATESRGVVERPREGDGALYARDNEFGAFVYVPEAGEETEEGFPDDLVEVFALAREYDCFWIKFDRDAAEINALPVYDWDKAPCDHDWQSHPGVRGVCAKCGEER